MARAWVVAVREYVALVATKAFVLGLLVAPAMMGLAILVADGDADGDADGAAVDELPRVVAVADQSGKVLPRLRASLEAAGYRVREEPVAGFDAARQRELADEVRSGELLGIVEIGAAAASLDAGPEAGSEADSEADKTRIYVESVVSSGSFRLETLVATAVQLSRMQALGISEADAAALMRDANVARLPLPGAGGELTGDAALVRVLAAIVTLSLVFIAVLTASMPLLQAVIEEKQQRIAEVLLGAVSPFQLMVGKLLGAVGVVLTTLLFYGGLGWLTASYIGYADHVSLEILGPALLVAAVASVLYGAIFLALGAAANELKDAQGLMMPVILVLFAPLIALGSVAANPHSPLAVGLSLFPFTAPMFMPVRMALAETLPAWQIALALVLTAATLFAVVWAAGRIFRIGILSHGRMPSFGELARWLRA